MHALDLRLVWLNFQALESQFEAEAQWEWLLTAKNTKVQIFAARFVRELLTASPPTSTEPDHPEIASGGPDAD